MSVFPDAQIHIGGDEFWAGCWSQCEGGVGQAGHCLAMLHHPLLRPPPAAPSVSAWMTAQNITVVEAYYYYERRMIDIARGLGRSVLAWQDIQGYNGTSTSLDVGESNRGYGPSRCA